MEDVISSLGTKILCLYDGRLSIYIKGENEVIDLSEKLKDLLKKKNLTSQNSLNKGYFLKHDANIFQFISTDTQRAYEFACV